MGYYTTGTNRITGTEELVANENYVGSVGASTIVIESIQNDMALFEALLMNDFTEVSMIKESAGEEEIMSLLEASGAGFIDRIKEALKKIWEKIKGLIKSFITNLMSVVIRDNKTFVNKYKQEVLRKDLSKMKYKWSKSKKGADEVVPSPVLNMATKSLTATAFDSMMNFDKVVRLRAAELDQTISEIKTEKAKDEAISAAAGFRVEYATAYDDVVGNFFEEVDEHEGLSSALLGNIIEILSESKKILKEFADAEKAANKVYNERLRELDKARSAVSKLAPSGGSADFEGGSKTMKNKEEVLQVSKALNYMYAIIQVEQDIAIKGISISMQMTKWKIKEARAVFARAAAFNPKSVKESAELMDGIDDVAFHIMEQAFEGEYAY